MTRIHESLLVLFLAVVAGAMMPPVSAQEFVRGDPQSDGAVDISDAIVTLSYLFVPGTYTPPCLDAGDVNDDGVVDVADPVYLFHALFLIGPPPLEPYPACGVDQTPDGLDCTYYTYCP